MKTQHGDPTGIPPLQPLTRGKKRQAVSHMVNELAALSTPCLNRPVGLSPPCSSCPHTDLSACAGRVKTAGIPIDHAPGSPLTPAADGRSCVRAGGLQDEAPAAAAAAPQPAATTQQLRHSSGTCEDAGPEAALLPGAE